MDQSRKRTIRFTVALTVALTLAGLLVYTSFSAGSETKTPSQLLVTATAGKVYELTGKVVPGSIRKSGDNVTEFRVHDRTGRGGSVQVRYTGAVPDPFRDGREIIVDVRKQGAIFVGQKDSLVTKCPSKFTAEKQP